LGSAPYLSPEQVMGVRCDPRSDIFALGVILYELATGQLPFGSPTSPGGLRQRLFRDPLPPRALEPSLPEWFQEIVLRCLEVDAGRRYATAAQLAFDLQHGEQVPVGERGRRTLRQGVLACWRRRVWALGFEPAPCPPPAERIADSPIVLVAVATLYGDPVQEAALRDAVRRLTGKDKDYRIAAVTVIPPQPVFGASRPEDSGGRIHIRHLVELKQWAGPLDLPDGRLTCHVLEEEDAAEALLAFARLHQVDQILLGAPPRLGAMETGVSFRGLQGTVAARVVLEAPCTVTLVRP